MWKKISYAILIFFSVPMLCSFQSMTAQAANQGNFFDITLTNSGTTTDPGGNGSNSGDNETINGNNGGQNQDTKAPGTNSEQQKTLANGRLPQTNNVQQGFLLGILVLIVALITWMFRLINEGKRGRKR